MRRLNVHAEHIDECIQSSMFALSVRPSNPELQPGELLLLQLAKNDARRLGALNQRVNFALVFERLEHDPYGVVRKKHWPVGRPEWQWIVYGLATIPTIPFSLEDLNLSREYGGMDNARLIAPNDEARILPLILWSLAQSPQPERQMIPSWRIAEEFGHDSTLAAIYNHDRIALLNPAPQRIVTISRFERNPFLGDSLKSFYRYKCQVCLHDFKPKYGRPFAQTHHIQYLHNDGPDISGNIVVLCPNHHRIIHETNAQFQREALTYQYPNGLREKLLNAEHLLNAPGYEVTPSQV
jgi:HNH endonuclease